MLLLCLFYMCSYVLYCTLIPITLPPIRDDTNYMGRYVIVTTMYCRLLCSVTTCNWNRYYYNINLYYLSNRCGKFCSRGHLVETHNSWIIKFFVVFCYIFLISRVAYPATVTKSVVYCNYCNSTSYVTKLLNWRISYDGTLFISKSYESLGLQLRLLRQCSLIIHHSVPRCRLAVITVRLKLCRLIFFYVICI